MKEKKKGYLKTRCWCSENTPWGALDLDYRLRDGRPIMRCIYCHRTVWVEPDEGK